MFDRILQTTRSNSFFLFGARGTGKTTYIRGAFSPDESLYIDLLDPEIEDTYRRTPQRLEHEVNAGTYEYGKAFEHLIVTQIAHLAQYRCPDWRLSYLRTGSGAEIDLVIERPGQTDAIIEIKSSPRVDDRDVRVLARFAGDFANATALCVSRDPARMRVNGVLCLHWRDALAELGLA